jgi:hypothetical protein
MDSPRPRHPERTADYEVLANINTDRVLPRLVRERLAVLALTPTVRSISRQETLEVHSWEMGCVLKGSCYREVRGVTDFRTL